MQKKGVSLEFVDEISDRFSRLKELGELYESQSMSSIEASLQLMQVNKLHDSNAGVPPPMDQEADELLVNTKEVIESIKHENSKMKQDIENSLRAFKKANSAYMHSETADKATLGNIEQEIQGLKGLFNRVSSEDCGNNEIEDIFKQIEFLQDEINAANLKVNESETLILNKEIENLELRHKIQSLEGSYQLHNRRQPLCKCILF